MKTTKEKRTAASTKLPQMDRPPEDTPSMIVRSGDAASDGIQCENAASNDSLSERARQNTVSKDNIPSTGMPYAGPPPMKPLRTKRYDSMDTRFIDVLDGIRAISVIIVMIFHFWQQTWIWPTIQTPWLAPLGITRISFDSLASVGYLFVDAMVLLSGFLLFLPLARHILCGEPMIDWKNYAKKRVARILPSYLFSILVILLCIAIPNREYQSTGAMLKDLFAHLTFTQTLWYDTYIGTKLNVVLWTVAIEVWFYILFPFIAKFIGRRRNEERHSPKPLHRAALVYVVFNAIAWWYIYICVIKGGLNLSMSINQFPAFLGVYANGMVGALLYVSVARSRERTPGFAIVNTIIAIASLFVIGTLINDCAAASSTAQVWQITERFKLSFAFITFILSAAFSMKWFRWLFSNRLMRFLSGISYNLYIWHQYLAVQLKYTWRIPNWVGNTPPNQLNNHTWMWQYALVITVVAFAAAILATYLIEKPCANLILGKYGTGRGGKRGKRREKERDELRGNELRGDEARGNELRGVEARGNELRGDEVRGNGLRGNGLRGVEVRGNGLRDNDRVNASDGLCAVPQPGMNG